VKIFVENLTHSITNNDLIKLFELSGDVESVTIVNDKFSGKPGGFVEMPNRLEALEMIQNLNGVTLFGKTLILSTMRERGDRRADVERRSEQDRRVSSQRKTELDRRKINARRMSSNRRLDIDRRQ